MMGLDQKWFMISFIVFGVGFGGFLWGVVFERYIRLRLRPSSNSELAKVLATTEEDRERYRL